LEIDDSHATKYEFLKIQDAGQPPYFKSFFGHNSAADFSEILREEAVVRGMSAF